MEIKIKYQSPLIETITLDNEISLQLSSFFEPLGEPIDWETNALDPFSEDTFVVY
jgi:hypothetical protein